MGNSLRCCLACVLPCGALDLIRIVHLDGYIQELTGRVTAGEVLKDNPNHVLTKPCSQGVSCRIRPESELKRGSIYFLVPAPSSPPRDRITKKYSSSSKRRPVEAPAEKKSLPVTRCRKVTAAGEWRPHLDSISEDL